MSKIEHSQTYPVTPNATAGDIKAWLSTIPEYAKVSTTTQTGDWNYPDTHSLHASWSTDVGGW